MPRVKRGTISLKRRRNVLVQAKGYRFGRKSKEKQAKEAIAHAGTHAFQHRRKKKRLMRKSFQVTINYAVRKTGVSYSKFINQLKTKNVGVDRKILSQLAKEHPEIFIKIAEKVSK